MNAFKKTYPLKGGGYQRSGQDQPAILILTQQGVQGCQEILP